MVVEVVVAVVAMQAVQQPAVKQSNETAHCLMCCDVAVVVHLEMN